MDTKTRVEAPPKKVVTKIGAGPKSVPTERGAAEKKTVGAKPSSPKSAEAARRSSRSLQGLFWLVEAMFRRTALCGLRRINGDDLVFCFD